MLDHIGIRVQKLSKAKLFYQTALKPLGYKVIMEIGPELGVGYEGVGFGTDKKPDFWIGAGVPTGPTHIAFTAPDRKSVDAFHFAALHAGAKDNGAPGLRPHYHPAYYGAFILDPDGNNLEAVCHKPA